MLILFMCSRHIQLQQMTEIAKSAKIRFAYLFDRLWFGYMPSHIYDSVRYMRAIKRVSVVFFFVKTSATHLISWSCFVDMAVCR